MYSSFSRRFRISMGDSRDGSRPIVNLGSHRTQKTAKMTQKINMPDICDPPAVHNSSSMAYAYTGILGKAVMPVTMRYGQVLINAAIIGIWLGHPPRPIHAGRLS